MYRESYSEWQCLIET